MATRDPDRPVGESPSDAATERAHTSQLPASSDDPHRGSSGFSGDVVTVYDTIGHGYTATRRPDVRIAALVDAALGDARTVLNVGAGTGSYEPLGREVTAVEPSAVMIAQRPCGRAGRRPHVGPADDAGVLAGARVPARDRGAGRAPRRAGRGDRRGARRRADPAGAG